MEFDDVDVKIQQDFIEKMFLSHPYREPIIGRRDLFAKLTKANLQDYYQHRYSPDNMVLALAGSIDINKTKELVEKYFGQIKKRENSLVVIPEEMAFTSRRYSPTILPIEKPRMKLGFHGVNAFHSDAVALDILDAILSYGQSSWLYKKYINTALLYSIETSNWTPFHKGYFEITSVYNSEEINISSEQILENIHALFSEKKQNNSKELILKGAIKKISLGIYSNFYALNNMNTNIVNNEVQYGYYRWDESYLEHLNNLKWADIERVCQIYLNKNRMIESLYLNESLKSHLKNSKTKSDIFPTIEIKKDDCKISYLDNGLRLLIQSFSR